MKPRLTIIKVGGGIIEDPEALPLFLSAFVQASGPKILVHGGGRTATEIASQMGIDSPMHKGRRITNEAMLRIVTMVYGGLVNKQLVANLQAHGEQAIGLTGADLNIISAHRRPPQEVDYGFVGEIDHVQSGTLTALLEQAICPVLAPLTHDGKGQLFNTNADTIAGKVAQAMTTDWEVNLVFAFERPGVLTNPDDDQSLVPTLKKPAFEQMQRDGQIAGGMIPKLSNAFAAIEAGVKQVIICRYDQLGNLFTPDFIGTQLS